MAISSYELLLKCNLIDRLCGLLLDNKTVRVEYFQSLITLYNNLKHLSCFSFS